MKNTTIGGIVFTPSGLSDVIAHIQSQWCIDDVDMQLALKYMADHIKMYWRVDDIDSPLMPDDPVITQFCDQMTREFFDTKRPWDRRLPAMVIVYDIEFIETLDVIIHLEVTHDYLP